MCTSMSYWRTLLYCGTKTLSKGVVQAGVSQSYITITLLLLSALDHIFPSDLKENSSRHGRKLHSLEEGLENVLNERSK